MSIKITPADSWFSKAIRQRAGWRCEKCGTQYDESSTGLHCSHFHGRGNWSVRLNPDNARALCYGCHRHMEANPYEHTKWFEEWLGEARFQILLDRKRDISLGKEYKKTKGKGEISKHYKGEYERMKANPDHEIVEFI